MSTIAKIDLKFQEGGYSAEELDRYRRLFEDEFEVESETYEQPAAGAAFGLLVVVTFVASAVAGGVIYDVLKAASTRLLRIFKDRKKSRRHVPETSAVQLEFSDVTVVIGIDDRGRFSPDEYSLNETAIEKLDEIAKQVSAHLAVPPLQNAGMKFLHVPVLAAQDAPTEPLIKRHWKLSAERSHPLRLRQVL